MKQLDPSKPEDNLSGPEDIGAEDGGAEEINLENLGTAPDHNITEDADCLPDDEGALEKQLKRLKTKRDRLNDRATGALEKQLKRLKTKGDRLNDRIEEVWEKQLEQLTTERDDYKAKRDAYLSDLQQVTKERDASLSDQQQMADELEQLKAEHDAHRAKRDAYLSDLLLVTAERDAFKAERDASLSDQQRMADELEQVTAERDTYLSDLQRVTADFANFRRQTEKRKTEIEEQAASYLVKSLLPVLDAFEAAMGQDMEGSQCLEGISALHLQLLGVLEKQGLTVIGVVGEPFDPNRHEAVKYEPPDDSSEPPGDAVPVVAAVLRSGYAWNKRVLRPAMVIVRG